MTVREVFLFYPTLIFFIFVGLLAGQHFSGIEFGKPSTANQKLMVVTIATLIGSVGFFVGFFLALRYGKRDTKK
jgi:hypothetical protein